MLPSGQFFQGNGYDTKMERADKETPLGITPLCPGASVSSSMGKSIPITIVYLPVFADVIQTKLVMSYRAESSLKTGLPKPP